MAATYNRVVVRGTFVGGEVWTVNPCFTGAGGTGGGVTTFEELQDWVDALLELNDGSIMPDTMAEIMSSAASIVGVRVEALTAEGVLLQAAEGTLTLPRAGASAPSAPMQTALVTSLLTGRPGRSYSGRLFWPALDAPILATTVRVSTANTSIYAADVAGWLGDVAGAAPAGAALSPVVVSHKLGIQTPITNVRVGDVLDTQRRRRDALVENYSTSPVS